MLYSTCWCFGNDHGLLSWGFVSNPGVLRTAVIYYVLQDFTGVPAVVDFAAMRDAVKDLGGDPNNINPTCPADLVIDHSVQVEFSRT